METTPTTARTGLKFGVIAGVIFMVFSTIINVTDSAGSAWPNLLYLILLGVIIWALYEFRAQNGGYMSFGQGLTIGTFVGAIASLLNGLFSYVYTEFIDPTLIQRMKDMSRIKMEEQGLSDEQIDKAIEIQEMIFNNPGIAFIGGIVWFTFVSFIITLVVSAIMKRDKPFQWE